MRKYVSVILFLSIVLIQVLSYATDYSSMSDQELQIEFEGIQKELEERSLNQSNDVLKNIQAFSESEKRNCFHSTGSLSDFELEQFCVLGGTAPVALAAFDLQKEDIEILIGNDYIYHDYGFHREMVYGLCNFMGYWGNLVFSIDEKQQLEYIEIKGALYDGGYNDDHTEVIIDKIQKLTGIVPQVGRFEGIQYKFITPYIKYHYDSYYTYSHRFKDKKRRFVFRIYPGVELLTMDNELWNEKEGLNTAYSN